MSDSDWFFSDEETRSESVVQGEASAAYKENVRRAEKAYNEGLRLPITRACEYCYYNVPDAYVSTPYPGCFVTESATGLIKCANTISKRMVTKWREGIGPPSEFYMKRLRQKREKEKEKERGEVRWICGNAKEKETDGSNVEFNMKPDNDNHSSELQVVAHIVNGEAAENSFRRPCPYTKRKAKNDSSPPKKRQKPTTKKKDPRGRKPQKALQAAAVVPPKVPRSRQSSRSSVTISKEMESDPECLKEDELDSKELAHRLSKIEEYLKGLVRENEELARERDNLRKEYWKLSGISKKYKWRSKELEAIVERILETGPGRGEVGAMLQEDRSE